MSPQRPQDVTWGPGCQQVEVSVTCTVDGLVPLERTLTQGPDPGHGAAENHFHGFHEALGVGGRGAE